MKLLKIVESDKPEKKLMAVFQSDSGRTKTVHFGQRSADDYTITKDKAQRERYLNRHKANEDWSNPTSAGALARFVLWSSTTIAGGIRNYRKRFNL